MKEGWKYMPLGDICDFEGGSQPPKSEWEKQSQNGYVRMLQIRDFTKSRDFEIEYVKLSKKLRLCKADDILIGRYGASVGKILTGLEGAYNVAIIKSIPNEKVISKKYIRRYFESPLFQYQLAKVCNARAAQAGFSKEDIVSFQIPVPSHSEQHRIVEYLDTQFAKIDALKTNAEQQLQAAKDLFQSALKDLMTPKEGWEEKKLGEITSKIGSGATPKGGKKVYLTEGCSLIRSLNVLHGHFKYEDLAHITDEAAEQLKGVVVKENDVLFNITGASIARSCVVPQNVLPARVNQHVSILRIKDQSVSPIFLCYLLLSKRHQKKLLTIGESGSTRQALTKQDLENHIVEIPNIDEQNSIIKFITHISQSIEDLQSNYTQTLTLCNDLKKSLLKKIFE